MKICLLNVTGYHSFREKTLTVSEVRLRKVIKQEAKNGWTPFASVEDFIDKVTATNKHAVTRELKVMPGSPPNHTKRSRVLVITNFGPAIELNV